MAPRNGALREEQCSPAFFIASLIILGQLLLECINRFCTKVDMEVKVKKTIGMVFSSPKTNSELDLL
jgi:hypothetical protein